MNINIKADAEYNADEFWAHLDQQLPQVAEQLRSSHGYAQIDQETWSKVQQLPGFGSGPEHAKHALVVTDHAQFCSDHAGCSFSTVRSLIQSIDFGDCYPVVDRSGNLTGECVPGDADGYSICDIDNDDAPRVHEHASEAVIADGPAFCSAAELQSYVDARWRGIIVAASDDGLEVAFGDQNHSPTGAEFEPLSGLTADYVDGVIAEFILRT